MFQISRNIADSWVQSEVNTFHILNMCVSSQKCINSSRHVISRFFQMIHSPREPFRMSHSIANFTFLPVAVFCIPDNLTQIIYVLSVVCDQEREKNSKWRSKYSYKQLGKNHLEIFTFLQNHCSFRSRKSFIFERMK